MGCLKCGRETADREVFCPDCLDLMEKNPVKPGIRVVLPKRPKAEPAYVPVKKQSPEEIIEKLRKRIRLLVILCLVLAAGFAAAVGIIIHHHTTTEHGGFGIGQNYSTEAADNAPHGR